MELKPSGLLAFEEGRSGSGTEGHVLGKAWDLGDPELNRKSKFSKSMYLENHRRIIGNSLGDLLAVCLGHFYGQYVSIIGLKAPGNYSASIWINKILICFLENPKLPISMISGFLNPSPSAKTIYCLSLETPGHLKE